jgi:hypothetical protein
MKKAMSTEGRPMVARHHDFTITVISERRPDDTWTALAAVTRASGGAPLVRGVPLLEGPAAEFSTEAEARDYALRAAEEWIDENLLPPSHDQGPEKSG